MYSDEHKFCTFVLELFCGTPVEWDQFLKWLTVCNQPLSKLAPLPPTGPQKIEKKCKKLLPITVHFSPMVDHAHIDQDWAMIQGVLYCLYLPTLGGTVFSLFPEAMISSNASA